MKFDLSEKPEREDYLTFSWVTNHDGIYRCASIPDPYVFVSSHETVYLIDCEVNDITVAEEKFWNKDKFAPYNGSVSLRNTNA